MADQPTTDRAEAVRAWAYDTIIHRPPGLGFAFSVDTVGVLVMGEADDTRIMVSAEADDARTFPSGATPDELAEGAGLLLGAADALQALSVLADAERAPTTIRED